MITLQLIDVPFDADVANPQGRPLGTKDTLAARLADLLPGTLFDNDGRGVFRRGSYEIAFKMYGDPPMSLGIAFEQPEAFAAITRVVEKTNWCLIDPEHKSFVDIAASRAAGRVVPLGHDGAGLLSSAPAGQMDRGRSATAVPFTAASTELAAPAARRTMPRRTRLLVAALTGLAIASAGLWYANKLTDGRLAARLPTSILANRKETSHRIERYEDRARRRAALEPMLAPQFRNNKVVQQMLDVQLASRAYWNFIDGKFSPPELLSNETIWSRYKMPTFLPATFAQRQRDGYEFEFRGAGCEATEANWPECTAYAYFARPVNRESDQPTFALFSSDERIHYSRSGNLPSRNDPTIIAATTALPIRELR